MSYFTFWIASNLVAARAVSQSEVPKLRAQFSSLKKRRKNGIGTFHYYLWIVMDFKCISATVLENLNSSISNFYWKCHREIYSHRKNISWNQFSSTSLGETLLSRNFCLKNVSKFLNVEKWKIYSHQKNFVKSTL